jgi:hypothetical protein
MIEQVKRRKSGTERKVIGIKRRKLSKRMVKQGRGRSKNKEKKRGSTRETRRL